MNRILLACVLLCSSVLPTQADDWSKMDTALQTAFVAVTVTDWAQTRHAARDWQRQAEGQEYGVHYRETNPLLGEYPSKKRVDVYFVSYLASHSAVSYMLPKPYRTIWQSVFIGIEIASIRNNCSINMKIRF